MSGDNNMDRFLLALGGFAGFSATLFASLGAGGDDISSALPKAAIGMIAGTLVVKGFIMVAHSAFREARREKIAAKKAKPQTEQNFQSSAAETPQNPAQNVTAQTTPSGPTPPSQPQRPPLRARPVRQRRNAS